MAEHEFEVAQAYSGPPISLSPEAEAQYGLITRNLAEMTSSEIVRKVLSEGESVKCYWGRSSPGGQLFQSCFEAGAPTDESFA